MCVFLFILILILVSGVLAIHNSGLVHRFFLFAMFYFVLFIENSDLKLENILCKLVNGKLNLKIADFGLTKGDKGNMLETVCGFKIILNVF
jgi:serine/threonine protein kinase